MALFMQAGAVCAQSAQPVPNANLFIEQERRDAERALQQRAQQERNADVKLPPAPQASVGLLPTEESPCFKIDLVTLNTGRDGGPQDLLDAVGQTTSGAVDSPIGRCLGAQGVQVVMDRLQNKLIAQGYVIIFNKSRGWGQYAYWFAIAWAIR
jgi:hemolysin activation/secretion protein